MIDAIETTEVLAADERWNIERSLPEYFKKKSTAKLGSFTVTRRGNKYLFASDKCNWLVTLTKRSGFTLKLTVDGKRVPLTAGLFMRATDALYKTPEATLTHTANAFTRVATQAVAFAKKEKAKAPKKGPGHLFTEKQARDLSKEALAKMPTKERAELQAKAKKAGMHFAKASALGIVHEPWLATAAAEPTTDVYTATILHVLTRHPVEIGDGLTVMLRARAKLAGKPDYVLKFTYKHAEHDIPDLELVLYVGIDPDMQVFGIRKIRAVSKSAEYKNTAKDAFEVLAGTPEEVAEALRRDLGPNHPLGKYAVLLYHKAMQHLGHEHVAVTKFAPIDYAQAIMHAMHGQRIPLGDDAFVTPRTVTNLVQDPDDCVLKFKLDSGIEGAPADLEMHLYLTPDKEMGGAAIRKVRLFSKSMEHLRDSDKRITVGLPIDVQEAVRDLRESIESGYINQSIVNAMFSMRTKLDAPAPGDSGWKPDGDSDHKDDEGLDPDALLREWGLE